MLMLADIEMNASLKNRVGIVGTELKPKQVGVLYEYYIKSQFPWV